MLTPQDIQEISFQKAVFGGYDMASVDDILEPLTQDYLTLYKENTVLKSKMRLLVEKLEEYRNNEDSMKNALVAAQKASSDLVAQAEKRCAAMLAEAESNARNKSRDIDNAVSSEKERLNRAKAATRDFIATVEADINRQLQLLGSLKLMDLEQEPVAAKVAPAKVAPAKAAPAREDSRRAYDYEREPDAIKSETPDAIADEIEQNVEKIMGEVSAPEPANLGATRVMPAIKPTPRSDRFADLQFGKNYDPTKP